MPDGREDSGDGGSASTRREWGQMLPYLNTVTWRNARAGTRVSEMQNLLRSLLTHDSARKFSSTAAREDGAGKHDIPSLSMQEWAKLLSQPLVQVLINKLELLYVAPLEDDRVVRELLGDATALGVQMVTGSCKPAQTMLRQMGAACSAASTLVAFQRALCVEDGILKCTWFEAVSQGTVNNLIREGGGSTFGRTSWLPNATQETIEPVRRRNDSLGDAIRFLHGWTEASARRAYHPGILLHNRHVRNSDRISDRRAGNF